DQPHHDSERGSAGNTAGRGIERGNGNQAERIQYDYQSQCKGADARSDIRRHRGAHWLRHSCLTRISVTHGAGHIVTQWRGATLLTNVPSRVAIATRTTQTAVSVVATLRSDLSLRIREP